VAKSRALLLKELPSPKRLLKNIMNFYFNCLFSDILSSAFARTHPSRTLSCLLCDVSHWIVTTFHPTNLGICQTLFFPLKTFFHPSSSFLKSITILSPQAINFVTTKAYQNCLGFKHSRNSTIVYQALVAS
jgi:hypothetical protein